MEKDILDLDEAMELLKTSRQTFYRWLKSGRIRGFKAGKQWRFYRDDLVAFMESTGTEFVVLMQDFRETINFFEKRLGSKGISLEAERKETR